MIKYSMPFIGKEEKRNIVKAITNKEIQGEGRIGKSVEKKLCRLIKARKAFLTTSGTHALELAMMALKINRGDEVICPSFTFVSTANAIIRHGAKPVFCEIDEGNLNLNIDDALNRITKKTKAIVPVHYGGFSCDMNLLSSEALKKRLYIVEDAAQSVGALYDGKPLGTFGDLGCLSFHSTKNITCGEGGAVIVNHDKFDEVVRICREKGTNRSLFLEGKISKYTWVDVGSSFVISDILSSILSAQLDKLGFITKRRRQIFDKYYNNLLIWHKSEKITLPKIDKKSYGNGHIFWFLLDRKISREKFIYKLRSRGIDCTHHYVPLHSSPFGLKNLNYKRGELPVTEDIASRIVRLPVYPDITDAQIDHIVDSVGCVLKYIL